MQSVTVLLIEMEVRALFHANGASYITLRLKIGLEWLNGPGSISVPAQGALGVRNSIFHRLFSGPRT